MSRHLLPALALSLLLLGCACGPAYAANGALANSVPLFLPGTTKLPEKMGDKDLKNDVKSFHSPFLAGGNGVMVAIAEARYTESEDNSIDVAARYIGTEGANWADKATENNGGNWATRLVLQRKEGTHHSVLRVPVAVVKGNKIYLLALNDRKPDGTDDGDWHLEVVVGEITGEVGNKGIEWDKSESLRSKLEQKIGDSLKVSPLDGHSAFLTSKGRIVFSANAKNKEGKRGLAIMQLKDSEEQWEVSFVEKPKECHFHSFLEWKQKLIMLSSHCRSGSHLVTEYAEEERKWKDITGSLFRPWDDLYFSRDFTTMSIGNESVMLFTERISRDTTRGRVTDVHFCVSDGSRVHCAGRIATDDENTAFGGLLYTNGELFSLHQDTGKAFGTIDLTRLKGELGSIKSVLSAWEENDAYFSRPCKATSPKGASPDTLCLTPMPTAGLVGFLSDKGDATHWHDEYLFRNATVKGAVKVDSGYTFSGANSGAQWPLRRAGFGQRYAFSKFGLTVVATVTVHETSETDTPLLTVSGNGVDGRWGLWCSEKQWKVRSKNSEEESVMGFEIQKTYKVALIVQNNTISAYVNGNSLGSPLPISAPGKEPFDIKDVFIGGYDHGGKINMTVTNVFLYKRVLHDTELKAASRIILTTTSTHQGNTRETNRNQEETPKTPAKPNETPETPATPNETPRAPTDPEEDSSELMRMGVSLLFLLGLRALAVFFPASI